MEEAPTLHFGAFRIDPGNACLWREQHLLPLTPKAFAVLCYLVAQPGQLVTKEELFHAVWPGTVVSDAALTVCIQEIRRALADGRKAPRYIETVYGRGYRFVASVTTSPSLQPHAERGRHRSAAAHTPHAAPILVGREAELQQLHGYLDTALTGERQVVFVTGEPGIGKTAVVERFLEHVATTGAWVGFGQCIEHFGAGEAYLPVLAALGQLGRAPHGKHLVAILGHHAPTWLGQLPALLRAGEHDALQQQAVGVTRERMLRELAEAIEALTATQPLVLVLEDLHWSDTATLALMAFLAQRHHPARLLLIGTYRPVEVIVRAHPLKTVKQELHLHGRCAEMPLRFLTAAEIGEYLQKRFAAGSLSNAPFHWLATAIHHHTEGNPLFMVNVVQDLVARGVLEQRDAGWTLTGQSADAVDIPESLRQMVERQFARLMPEEQHLLEVASAAGRAFSAAAIAAGLEGESGDVEERCTALAHHSHFLQTDGIAEWPDGTVATNYRFVHALYQDVIYARVSIGWCVRVHQRIGARLEAAYGERAGEIAAELAVHFERGRDSRRAVQYHHLAGEHALRRHAHQEAIGHLTTALRILDTWPATPARDQHELALHMALGPAFVAAHGWGAAEVGRAYTRARALCHTLGETSQLFAALMGLRFFATVRGEWQMARALGAQLLQLAQHSQDAVLLQEAHYAVGITCYCMGELAAAHAHFAQSLAFSELQRHRSRAFLYGMDPGVISRSIDAVVLWQLGYPDQAVSRNHEALALAHELAHPNSLAYALTFAGVLYSCRREPLAVQEQVETVLPLAHEHGFPMWLGFGTTLQGWVLAEQGQTERGLALLRQGAAAWQATGAEVWRPSLLALAADACWHGKKPAEGLTVVAEALALVEQGGGRFHEAELYRLNGALLLQTCQVSESTSPVQTIRKAKVNRGQATVSTPHLPAPHTLAEVEAEACFLKAIEVARKQQAKSLELRAIVSLARVWRQQGKKDEARQMLTEIYGWFTEGFDTADLKEAKGLLEE